MAGLVPFLSAHVGWSLFFVFLIALLESLAIVGIAFPGAAMMVVSGMLVATGALPLGPVLVVAIAGAVAGDGISFWLGRHFGPGLKEHPRLERWRPLIEKGERFFHRHGGKSILFGRFVGPVRPVIPLVAGMLAMPHGRFVAVNLLSAVAWAPAYLFPGIVLGQGLTLASNVGTRLAILLGVLIGAFWLGLWLISLGWHWTRRSGRAARLGGVVWARRHLKRHPTHPLRFAALLVDGLLDPSVPHLRTVALLALFGALGVAAIDFSPPEIPFPWLLPTDMGTVANILKAVFAPGPVVFSALVAGGLLLRDGDRNHAIRLGMLAFWGILAGVASPLPWSVVGMVWLGPLVVGGILMALPLASAVGRWIDSVLVVSTLVLGLGSAWILGLVASDDLPWVAAFAAAPLVVAVLVPIGGHPELRSSTVGGLAGIVTGLLLLGWSLHPAGVQVAPVTVVEGVAYEALVARSGEPGVWVVLDPPDLVATIAQKVGFIRQPPYRWLDLLSLLSAPETLAHVPPLPKLDAFGPELGRWSRVDDGGGRWVLRLHTTGSALVGWKGPRVLGRLTLHYETGMRPLSRIEWLPQWITVPESHEIPPEQWGAVGLEEFSHSAGY